jgi:hypothetical protein
MKQAIKDAIALLRKAEKAKSAAAAAKQVLSAIDILEKALKKKSGDGGSDPNP